MISHLHVQNNLDLLFPSSWALLLLTSKMNNALILRLHCKEVAEFNIVKTGFILEGSVIDTFPALDVEACKTKCVENNKCASINIEISTGQCQLNSKTIDDNRFKQTMFLKKQNGWSFITTDFGDPLVCTGLFSFQSKISILSHNHNKASLADFRIGQQNKNI